jgi:hypothetical protein
MQRFIVVAAGVANLLLSRSPRRSAGNGASGVGVATGITASRSGPSDTTRDWGHFWPRPHKQPGRLLRGLRPFMRLSRQ